METNLYPLFLRLQGKPCVVVGAGGVAARKVEALLAAGAAVTLVAPEAVEELAARARAGKLRWLRRPFRGADLDGAVLAFAATSDDEVNRSVAEEAARRGVWVNVADGPDRCDFQVPAAVRRGPVGVAVSSGGCSPALAAWVRDRVAEQLPRGVDLLAPLARELRAAVSGGPGVGARFRRLFDSGIGEDLARGDWRAVEEKVVAAFGRGQEVLEAVARCRAERP
ncbi:MAG: hypothetical protein Kow0092_02480 [Deferrisomatales bacterium]